MELSKIQWTDHTFNPWVGCTKVSPGCAHCYAEMLMDVRYKRVKWGMGNPRSRNGAEYWKKPLRWNAVQWGQCGCGYRGPVENGCPDCKMAEGMVPARQRVFCASLGDWLDDEVPEEWLADLLGLIHATPNLDWLLLTKRPENFQTRIKSVLLWLAEVQKTYRGDEHGWLSDWRHGVKAPHNVWIGASVEDQQRAKERIPELLGIPARVRFLSCEPLLGDVDIRKVPAVMMSFNSSPYGWHNWLRKRIHWIIAGGESGPGARKMETAWVRGLRDQCAEAGVPFFFKQWGKRGDGVGDTLDGRVHHEWPI